jgi:ketosteroid isomerase-like protein
MGDEKMELARRGFGAWRRGDFATVEALLDPGVQWRWFEPGEWDCRSRQDVMAVVRERYEQGFAGAELEFVDGGEDCVIVVAHPAAVVGEEWPVETATVMTFREGKVVNMQDYRTKEDALAALR